MLHYSQPLNHRARVLATKFMPSRKGIRKKSCSCTVCLQLIIDSSFDSEDQDSIECQGQCQKWLQTTCAGITHAAFNQLSNYYEPFLYYQCHLDAQTKEISQLISFVSQLSKNLSEIKPNLANPPASPYSSFADAVKTAIPLNEKPLTMGTFSILDPDPPKQVQPQF